MSTFAAFKRADTLLTVTVDKWARLLGYCPLCFRQADTDTIEPVSYQGVWTPSFIVCCFCGGLRDVIDHQESA